MPQGTDSGGHDFSIASGACSNDSCQQVGEAVARQLSARTSDASKELAEVKEQLEAMKKQSRCKN